MNDKDWHILKVLFDEKNITKAAKRLYISQPALTGRIQHLERELGCQIVIRGARGIDFSTEGEVLVDYATRALKDLQQTKEMIANIGEKVRGSLRIGCANIFAKYELPDILWLFMNQYPDVEINVKTGSSQSIYQMTLEGEVHVGIVSGEHPWPGPKHILCDEAYYAVSAKPIDIEKLPSLPRILYPTDGALQAALDNWWFTRFKQPPLVSMEIDAIDTCIRMVSKGLGYALLSGICLKSLHPLYKEKLLYNDGSALQRKTWMYYRDSTLTILTAKTFVDFLKSQIEHKLKISLI